MGEVRRATADEVRAATGFPIGGVAPVGHPAPLPTWIDVDLEQFPEIWAAGGTPDSIVGLTYLGLVTATGGHPRPVARRLSRSPARRLSPCVPVSDAECPSWRR